MTAIANAFLLAPVCRMRESPARATAGQKPGEPAAALPSNRSGEPAAHTPDANPAAGVAHPHLVSLRDAEPSSLLKFESNRTKKRQ